MKKKIIALTLICVGLIGTTAFADPIRSYGINASIGYDTNRNALYGGNAYTYTYYDYAETWVTAYDSSGSQVGEDQHARNWLSAVTPNTQFSQDITKLHGQHHGYGEDRDSYHYF